MTSHLYETPAFTIGKHQWRCIVKHYPHLRANCTNYEFRRTGDSAWRKDREWPSYNSDKWDNGCPAGLMRLYERHEAEIKAAIAGLPIPQPEGRLF